MYCLSFNTFSIFSKSSLAFSAPGNILGLAFEKRGNLTRPWSKIFTFAKRIQIYGFTEFIRKGGGSKYKVTNNQVYLKACELLERAIELEEQFDWVVIDGLQRTQITTTMRMKTTNSVEAFDNLPTKKLTKWGERTLYLENLVIDLASQAAKKGVIITSQDVVHKAMFLTAAQEKSGMKEEDIPVKEPAWKDAVKDEMDTVIYVSIVEKDLGQGRKSLKRRATVTTNKLGGGEGYHNITLQDDNQSTKKLIELLLTSDMPFEPIE